MSNQAQVTVTGSSQAVVTVISRDPPSVAVTAPAVPSVVHVSARGPQGPKGEQGDMGPPSNLSLGVRTSNTLDLNEDSGNVVTLPEVTQELAGLMTGADKQLLDGSGDESIAMAIALG